MVTTQYRLGELASDEAIPDGMKERLHFYDVRRGQDIIEAIELKLRPGDMLRSCRTELVYNRSIA